MRTGTGLMWIRVQVPKFTCGLPVSPNQHQQNTGTCFLEGHLTSFQDIKIVNQVEQV